MKTLSVTILIPFIIILSGVIAYFWFQNRSSELLTEKILSAICVAVFAILSALLFSLKSESNTINFNSTLYFHKIDKKPLDEYCGDIYKIGGSQFDISLVHFINDYFEKDELKNSEFNKDIKSITEFYHDLALIKLLYHFSWMYADWWNIYSDSVRRGRSFTSSVSPIKPIPISTILKWEDISKKLNDKSHFNKILTDFPKETTLKKITVPPKTNIEFVITEYEREILLKNPFVRISIAIQGLGGSMGLGDYQWYLGFDRKKSEEFWSEHFEVKCEAKFEKLRSGHPEMPRYKQWVESMFAEVQYQLDENERLKRAKEYRDLTKP